MTNEKETQKKKKQSCGRRKIKSGKKKKGNNELRSHVGNTESNRKVKSFVKIVMADYLLVSRSVLIIQKDRNPTRATFSHSIFYEN